jgi:hypothetical protein
MEKILQHTTQTAASHGNPIFGGWFVDERNAKITKSSFYQMAILNDHIFNIIKIKIKQNGQTKQIRR